MTAVREAIVLPAIFLTVTLVAAARIDARVVLAPPSLFSLVLGTMLIAALIRAGALAPARLLHGSRPLLANANGALVLASLFAAAGEVFAMLTPTNGLPMLFAAALLFVLLVNTLIVSPDRSRLLRSLAVTLGSALLLKFVILAGLSAPADSRSGRIFAALFDAATFGTVTQGPQPAAAGYAALFAVLLFLAGLSLLPRPRSGHHIRTELARR